VDGGLFMELKGKKIIVLVEDRYQILELWYPLIRMREAGARVVTVGPEKGRTYRSERGMEVTADEAAAGIDVGDCDAVIVPGGYSPDLMRRHPPMVRLVREAHARGKVVATICHAGWMLASADIIRGRRVTSFFSMKDDMIHAGAEWVDEPVVRDGTIITSRMPDDLPAFCREIIAAILE